MSNGNSLDELLSQYAKDESTVVFKDRDLFKSNTLWVGTGSGELDYNLGTLGFPSGIVEIAGKSRSGKTTIGLHCMKSFVNDHKNDDSVIPFAVILSSERRDNKEYAETIGLDTSRVLVHLVDDLETMFTWAVAQVKKVKAYAAENKKRPVFCFMWDSVGQTRAKSEVEATIEDVASMEKKGADFERKKIRMGEFARVAKQFSKWMSSVSFDQDALWILINHTYNQMDGYGKEISSGGEWLQYAPSIRLRTKLGKHEVLEEKGIGGTSKKVQVSQYSMVKVEKNDFGSRSETEIEILLGYGIVLSAADIELAVQEGVLEREGVKKVVFRQGSKELLSWSTKRTFYDNYRDPKKRKFMDVLHKKVSRLWHAKVLNDRHIDPQTYLGK